MLWRAVTEGQAAAMIKLVMLSIIRILDDSFAKSSPIHHAKNGCP
jgi:hypothetical protein